MENGQHGFMEEVVDRSTLLSAGGERRPDTLAPLAAGESSCSLGNLAVDHDKPNGLLREIVGGLNTRRRDEFEIGLSVLAKAPSDVLGLGPLRCAFGDFEDLDSGVLQLSLEPLRRHALSSVNDAEERADLGEEALSEVLRHRVQLLEELDVSNQVGEAELQAHVEVAHVLSIRREVIAAEDSIELLPEDIDQDSRGSRFVDSKEGVLLGAKAPCPELRSVLLVASLVNVQHVLKRKDLAEFLIHTVQGAADLGNKLAEVASRELEPDHIAEELSDRREGGVTNSLEVRDQCREPRA